MSGISVIAFWVVFMGAWLVLTRLGAAHMPRRGSGLWCVSLWCAVAVPSILQFAHPVLYDLGRRQPEAVRDGQVWRLFTSMFVQDGGWPGALSNLVVLGVTLLLVRRVLAGPAIAGLFLLGGVLGNILTVATFGQSGAGNSMATMFVATVAVVLTAGPRRRVALAALVLIAAAGGALLSQHDEHGLAVAAALLVGVVGRRSARHLREGRSPAV